MLRKFERAVYSIASFRSCPLWVVFLAPSLHALDDELINGLEVAPLQFFLYEPLCVGLELNSHRVLTSWSESGANFMISRAEPVGVGARTLRPAIQNSQ